MPLSAQKKPWPYKKAISLDPEHALYVNLGSLYKDLGNFLEHF